MGKKYIKALVINFLYLPIYTFNLFMYCAFLSSPFTMFNMINSQSKLSDLIAYPTISIALFTIGLNALVQNFTLDRKFIQEFYQHKDMVVSLLGFPRTWLIKTSMIRGIFYATAIIMIKLQRPSYAPIVNYLSNLDEFRSALKWYNYSLAWFQLISLVMLFVLACISIILQYVFNM